MKTIDVDMLVVLEGKYLRIDDDDASELTEFKNVKLTSEKYLHGSELTTLDEIKDKIKDVLGVDNYVVGFHFCDWDSYNSVYGLVKEVRSDSKKKMFGYDDVVLIGMDEETKLLTKINNNNELLGKIETISKNLTNNIFKFQTIDVVILSSSSNDGTIVKYRTEKCTFVKFKQECRRIIVKVLSVKIGKSEESKENKESKEIKFFLPHPSQSLYNLTIDNESTVKIPKENYQFNIYPIFIVKFSNNIPIKMETPIIELKNENLLDGKATFELDEKTDVMDVEKINPSG